MRDIKRQAGEIEVTEEMLVAGEAAVLASVGGADLGGYFSARDLAAEVFLAMAQACPCKASPASAGSSP